MTQQSTIDLDWRERAACKGKDVSLFYLEDKSLAAGAGGHPMRKLCLGCPVLEECRDYAIRNERFGYWGGMSARSRLRERSRLGIRLPQQRVRLLYPAI